MADYSYSICDAGCDAHLVVDEEDLLFVPALDGGGAEQHGR